MTNAADPGAPPAGYRSLELTLDLGRRQLLRAGVPVPLGRLTFELLVALIEAAPNVLSHDRLIEKVWRGRSTSPETVTQRVKLLRDALGDPAEQPRYVGLVRNQGYRWLAPVEALAAESRVQADSGHGRPAGSGGGESSGGRGGRGAEAAPTGAWRLVAGGVVTALAVLAAALVMWRGEPEPSDARATAIAVLPLVDYSSAADQEYFADGMTEALIANLAKLRGLTVISRTSTSRYKGTSKTVPEIAQELGVGVVLEGSMQLEGDRVRITAQLIDAATDRHIWAETYDRNLRDVLILQSELASRIAAEIEVSIAPGEARRLAAARPVNPETYRAYLRGMYHLAKATPEEVERGLLFLHEAVAADPGDALAYAGLALGYATLGHGPEPPADAWPRAAAAATRALTLDPDLAEAHAALAEIKLYVEWDWQGAEAAFERANELAPSLAMNHFHYAWYLGLFGRWEEAFAEHALAERLDPLNPLLTLWRGGLYLYSDLGRHADALEHARRALELSPDHPTALLVLGRAHSAAGRHEEAIAAHRRMVEVNPSFRWELGLTYSMAGRSADARAVLEQVEREPPTPWTAFGRAMLHARLGDSARALEWLRYEPHHAWVPWVRVDPWLRPSLEADAGFPGLLERLGLPL